MSIEFKLEPIGVTMQVMLDEMLGPEARSAAFAEFAEQEIESAKAVNESALGYVPPYETVVDGVKGAPLASVRPDGTIVTVFGLVGEIFLYVAEQLRKHSPVRSGQYRDSHTFIADGVAADLNNPPADAREYAFVSDVPYARKIERGLSKQSQVPPDGVYHGVATLANGRFSNIAKVSFGYRAPLFGSVNTWAGSASAARLAKRIRGGNPALHPEWLRRQPAIVITVR